MGTGKELGPDGCAVADEDELLGIGQIRFRIVASSIPACPSVPKPRSVHWAGARELAPWLWTYCRAETANVISFAACVKFGKTMTPTAVSHLWFKVRTSVEKRSRGLMKIQEEVCQTAIVALAVQGAGQVCILTAGCGCSVGDAVDCIKCRFDRRQWLIDRGCVSTTLKPEF